jgi:hypothetical protein
MRYTLCVSTSKSCGTSPAAAATNGAAIRQRSAVEERERGREKGRQEEERKEKKRERKKAKGKENVDTNP